ncbi:PIG-L deacetylase family protein [Alicyclobacillus fastidiosus]|uniref:PIG-L deacetylase family protein n=1 Tax=Alicyclobacillus fastidiosus TaxID=392011 RepID=A0ABV5AAF9_9BACL|nr:PIG-L deacetylase family protein [Alicyclobacillus fastidiosus]WEH07602.1 PIG-L family deacetylase [Alicyclobacillus fastidiosus]
MTNNPKGTITVVSAHSADFVWRAGGAIALYHDLGYQVRVLCLSYGERGESARLWKQGRTLDEIKAIRRFEAEQAAEILGAQVRFFDAGDYPLETTKELQDEIVQEFREHRPEFILTHSLTDPYNADHPRTTEFVLECRILAQAHGYPSDFPVIGAPPVFLYEPHQPEQCNFQVDVLLNITPVFERKRKAMECMAAQEHLWAYYTDVAKRRGVQAGRNSGGSIQYGEAYQRVYPYVGEVLV